MSGREWHRAHATDYRMALRVRPAEHGDYDMVVGLDPNFTICDGKDYLPVLYHEVLRTPNCYCFVGHFGKYLVRKYI